MKERIMGRKNFPTEEVEPINYINDDEIIAMIKKKDKYTFKQKSYYRLYNCVHCGECDTENERLLLKQKFLEDGNSVEGLDEMIKCFEEFRSPYPSNKMRIKRPEGIPDKSDTLFFMGCLSTIRIPRYTEHSLKYLLQHKVDFTILDTEICCGWPWFASGSMREFEICKEENIEIFKNFKSIICLCPACYFLFNKYYKPLMDTELEFKYISDYLKPSKTEKSGKVSIQHLCQLMNRGREGVDQLVNSILEKSGYEVINMPHWCCGGGLGYMHRTDIIEKIARKRMEDFKLKLSNENNNYITTYCPDAYWILRVFGRRAKIDFKLINMCDLLK